MKLSELSPNGLLVLVGLAAAGVVAFYVIRKGGLGSAAVGLVGDVATGAVGEIGAAVGLPRPTQTTTDPAVARWIMDHPLGGYFEASKWSGAPALLSASFMASGSGTAPPDGSELAARFPVLPQASYDETDRLAKRYPAAAATGDWFTDEEARQYEYGAQELYRLQNRPRPVTGSGGAAFGIYPKP